MSLFSLATLYSARSQASVADVISCFNNERETLFHLAFLIAGDRAKAEECVVSAYELTLRGKTPFRDWLFDWAKSATVRTAIRARLDEIQKSERGYLHPECYPYDSVAPQSFAERKALADMLLHMNPDRIVAEFDPFARAVLVLYGILNASVNDCAVQLNVSRAAVLAVQHRIVSWFETLPNNQPHAAQHAV